MTENGKIRENALRSALGWPHVIRCIELPSMGWGSAALTRYVGALSRSTLVNGKDER